MVRKQSGQPLTGWLAKAEGSAVPELRGFAQGVRQDEAAVAAAITEPWSNGPVEGQINRLKLIKRSMYGRGSLELLRRRVLHRGCGTRSVDRRGLNLSGDHPPII